MTLVLTVINKTREIAYIAESITNMQMEWYYPFSYNIAL